MNTDMKQIINESLWRELFHPDIFSGEASFGEEMKRHTSLRIGGPADVFAVPRDVISLKNTLTALKDKGIPFIPVGWGSNILVMDGGIGGVAISLRDFRRIVVVKEERNSALLFVESGGPLQSLVNFSKEKGFSGIEGLTGIPGSVGGAIAGNAGAFGYEIKDVLESAVVMSSEGIDKLDKDELGLEYRSSKIPGGAIILSANIRLKKGIEEEISKKIGDFLREKRERQPISALSAGCVFKNPEGAPAGRLIDEAGCKGMRIGNVEVSPMHANFFINKGNATASDFIRLMDEVKAKVMKVSGIELAPEIKIVGRG